MNKNLEAPCEACGGLLPLKAIQTGRRGKQRRSTCLLHPKVQKKLGEHTDKSSGKAEEGTTSSLSKRARELKKSPQFSHNRHNGQTEETSNGKKRINYDLDEQLQVAKSSVLEEQFQLPFAGQKTAKDSAIQCGIHRDQGQSTQQPKAKKLSQQEQRHARRHRVTQHSQRASVVRRKPKKTLSPANIDLTCLLHHDQGHNGNDPTRKRIAGHSPQDNDASNSYTSNPSVSSPQKKVHATTQSSSHRRKGQVEEEAATTPCSPPGHGSSTKNLYNGSHGQDKCRSTAIASSTESYQDGTPRVYEEHCHIHHVEEHITVFQTSSSWDSTKSQRRKLCIEPQQIVVRTCHQHVSHETVVQHFEGCHLHRGGDHYEHEYQRSNSRESTTRCERCGLPKRRDYSVKNEVMSLQGSAGRLVSKAYVKTVRTPDREVIIYAQTRLTDLSGLSPCIVHGDSGKEEKVDVCGVCCHPKKDHHNDLQRSKSPETRHTSPGVSNQGLCKVPRNPKPIQGCHLHREEPPASPKCQKPRDPLVWTPKVPKPRPCSTFRWLNRIIASQKIPPHIIREFLEGKRRCPPQAMKQKCPACLRRFKKDENDSPRGFGVKFSEIGWNPGSPVASSAVGCKERDLLDEKLSRRLMARTSVIKPIVKLSTNKEVWRSRKEMQCCSECWNPNRFGRWTSILEEMSKNVHEVGDLSTCDTKFLWHTAHESSKASNTQAMNLRFMRCPELYSTFRLRSLAQNIQRETFDRRAALQVAKKKGIKLDKQAVFAHLPAKRRPPEVKPGSSALMMCLPDVIAQKRLEPYWGLAKIGQPPNPICRGQHAPRGDPIRSKISPKVSANSWSSASQFCHDKVQSKPCKSASLSPSPSPSPVVLRPTVREHWSEERHWSQVVEAYNQAGTVKPVYDGCMHI